MLKLLLFSYLTLSCLCAFDANLAKNLYYLNAATYCRPAKVKDWTCGPC